MSSQNMTDDDEDMMMMTDDDQDIFPDPDIVIQYEMESDMSTSK